MKLKISTLIITVLLIANQTISAQNIVKLKVIITDLHLNYTIKSGTDPTIKIFDKFTNKILNPKDANNLNCLHFENIKTKDIALDYELVPIIWDLAGGTNLSFKIEGFEKNKKRNDCEFNDGGLFNKDNHHDFGEFAFDLKTIPPGVLSQKLTGTTNNGNYSIEYKIKYSLPNPDSVLINLQEPKLCSNQKIKLTTGTSLLPNNTGVLYKWEFKHPKKIDWELLTVTQSAQLELGAESISKDSIVNNLIIPIRVSLLTKDDISKSTEKNIEFIPAAPNLEKSSIKINNACYEKDNGSLYINNIQGNTLNYTLILREDGRKFCYPKNTKIPCIESDKIIYTNASNESIKNIRKGNFTLFLTNNDENQGFCFNTYPVKIDAFEKLEIVKSNIKPVSCSGLNDGAIELEIKGGYPATVMVNISPSVGKINVTSSTINISKVQSGSYKITVTDSCFQKVEFNAIVTQPPLPEIEITNIINSTCKESSNASFKVQVLKGNGPFIYSLYSENGVQLQKTVKTDSTNYTFNKLSPGKYNVWVFSNGNDSCMPIEKKILLEEDQFSAQLKVIKQNGVSCASCNNGVIQVSINDQKNMLVYILTNNSSNNQTITNTTGLFEGLSTGIYKVSVKRANSLCNEVIKLEEEIIIKQIPPQLFKIDSNKTTIDTTKKSAN